MRLGRLSVTLSLGLLGCSSSSSGVAPAPSQILTPETLPDAYAHAACDDLPPCCGAGWDVSLCVATWRGAAPKTVAAAGHAFDANAARACVDAMRASRQQVVSASCKAPPIDTLTPLPEVAAACSLVYTGSVPAGQPCASTIDCVAGLSCGPLDGAATGLCRSTAKGVPGGPCGETGPNDPVSHTCSADEGVFCSIDARSCTPWLPENAPCDQVEACGPTRMCNDGQCAKRLQPGEPCCWPFACTSGYCGKNDVCVAPDAIPPDLYCQY